MTADADIPHISRRYQEKTPSELGFEVGKNVDFVVANSLCHGCGTCEAVCPHDAVTMEFESKQGIYLPQIDSSKCTQCTLCVQACSGFELDLTDRAGMEADLQQHDLVGPHAGIHRAHTTDVERRRHAASGGMVTELAAHLLETGAVDGVILTRMERDNPIKAEGYIARSVEDLVPSQKSKYCPAPLNTILKGVLRREVPGTFAFVGLPHHVHGLRLLQRLYPHVRTAIPHVISLFTAHVPSQKATEFILFKKGIDAADVAQIEYRGGGNPGRMRIVTRDGGEHLIPHLDWIYSGHVFPLFFYPVREWLYFDKLSEWADYSCGDNWMRGLSEQAGASTVVTRSKVAERIMQDLVAAGRAKSAPMTAQELVDDQCLVTKLNIRSRLTTWQRLGRKIPLYTRTFERIPGQSLRTLRFALFVLVSERNIPFPLMNLVIRTDYYMRVVPRRLARKILLYLREGTAIVMPVRRADANPVRASRYKALLIGGFGYKDIGDEAMPHAIRVALRESLGDDLEIVMLSHDPACTEETHGERSRRDFTFIGHGPNASFSRKLLTATLTTFLIGATLLQRTGLRLRLWASARTAMDEIATSDLVLNVGGGNINSVIPSELYKKCTTFLVARLLGKPVFLSGQTMGPFTNWPDRIYARLCLNTVRMISFRDKHVSSERLHAIGVDQPIMFDAADDAISLKGVRQRDAMELLEAETGVPYGELKSSRVVLLNLKASLSAFKGANRSSDLSSEVAMMARIADKLIDEHGYTVIFCATDYSPEADDRICHELARSLMKHANRAHVLRREHSDDELIGIIGCADFVIGSRYHFCVFAASRCVPFLGVASGVYQRTKLKGLADLCGVEHAYVDADMEFADVEQVWPCVQRMIDDEHSTRAKLAERLPVLVANSKRVVHAVVDELKAIDARRNCALPPP